MQVSYAFVVPPIMSLMAQHPMVSKYNFSLLHRIVVAAAPVAAWTIEKTLERFNNPNLIAKQGGLLLHYMTLH